MHVRGGSPAMTITKTLNIAPGDVPVHVEISGSGPALLLVSSAASTSWWDALVQRWRETHTVVNYDYRRPAGHATEMQHYGSIGFGAHAIDLACQLGLQDVTIVGLSGGARASVCGAVQAPGLVGRLLLLAPAPPVLSIQLAA